MSAIRYRLCYILRLGIAAWGKSTTIHHQKPLLPTYIHYCTPKIYIMQELILVKTIVKLANIFSKPLCNLYTNPFIFYTFFILKTQYIVSHYFCSRNIWYFYSLYVNVYTFLCKSIQHHSSDFDTSTTFQVMKSPTYAPLLIFLSSVTIIVMYY